MRYLSNGSPWGLSLTLDDFFRGFRGIRGLGEAGASRVERFQPRVDVKDCPDEYVVEVELPGMDPKDVEVTLAEDTLTIRGEKKREEKHEGESWSLVERSQGEFKRSFSFPAPVAGGVEAEAKDGIVTIRVKKAKETKPERIEIKAR